MALYAPAAPHPSAGVGRLGFPEASHSTALRLFSSSSSSSTWSSPIASAGGRVSTHSAPAVPLLAPAPPQQGLQQQQQQLLSTALLQCPTRPHRVEGDWNTRMLFNRGLHTVKDVDKDTFWPAVEAAGDKLVVLDMYSRWCGPCRLIYPKLVKLSDKYADVVFLKLDCIPDNKPLFSQLGIGILPTFKLLKNSNVVSEVKGAKYDELVLKIEKARKS